MWPWQSELHSAEVQSAVKASTRGSSNEYTFPTVRACAWERNRDRGVAYINLTDVAASRIPFAWPLIVRRITGAHSCILHGYRWAKVRNLLFDRWTKMKIYLSWYAIRPRGLVFVTNEFGYLCAEGWLFCSRRKIVLLKVFSFWKSILVIIFTSKEKLIYFLQNHFPTQKDLYLIFHVL